MAVKHLSPQNIMETMDIVVPRSEIPTMLDKVKAIAKEEALNIISFGHAGDGNVHINVLKEDIPLQQWERLVPAVTEETYRLTLSLGGMLTGEHGIGFTRPRYLAMALDEAQIELMRADQGRLRSQPHPQSRQDLSGSIRCVIRRPTRDERLTTSFGCARVSPEFGNEEHGLPKQLSGTVFKKDHLQAIGQGGFKNLIFKSGFCSRYKKKTHKEEKQKSAYQ